MEVLSEKRLLVGVRAHELTMIPILVPALQLCCRGQQGARIANKARPTLRKDEFNAKLVQEESMPLQQVWCPVFPVLLANTRPGRALSVYHAISTRLVQTPTRRHAPSAPLARRPQEKLDQMRASTSMPTHHRVQVHLLLLLAALRHLLRIQRTRGKRRAAKISWKLYLCS